MQFVSILGASAAALITFMMGGLIIEGPLETAMAISTGPERVLLIILEVWPKLAHLLLNVIS